jgi:thioredoxin-like negative regulator of GroEL
MGDKIMIYKVNTDDNSELSSQLQIQGLPTMIFVGMNSEEPALRTEGLLPANTITDIVAKMAAQPDQVSEAQQIGQQDTGLPTQA